MSRDQLELGCLAMDSAIELLQREAGDIDISEEQAEQLADVCGCNALALIIIGGFIACEHVTAEVCPPCTGTLNCPECRQSRAQSPTRSNCAVHAVSCDMHGLYTCVDG